ncbi:hypothetical protein C8R45DRAFT_1085105 [Mycena sanguinolenta]|nr:hypothetical protein C8R45DRAFT_1085105 [Mycena sanguinolenta]
MASTRRAEVKAVTTAWFPRTIALRFWMNLVPTTFFSQNDSRWDSGTNVLSFALFLPLVSEMQALRGRPPAFVQIIREAVSSRAVLRELHKMKYLAPTLRPIFGPLVQIAAVAYAALYAIMVDIQLLCLSTDRSQLTHQYELEQQDYARKQGKFAATTPTPKTCIPVPPNTYVERPIISYFPPAVRMSSQKIFLPLIFHSNSDSLARSKHHHLFGSGPAGAQAAAVAIHAEASLSSSPFALPPRFPPAAAAGSTQCSDCRHVHRRRLRVTPAFGHSALDPELRSPELSLERPASEDVSGWCSVSVYSLKGTHSSEACPYLRANPPPIIPPRLLSSAILIGVETFPVPPSSPVTSYCGGKLFDGNIKLTELANKSGEFSSNSPDTSAPAEAGSSIASGGAGVSNNTSPLAVMSPRRPLTPQNW